MRLNHFVITGLLFIVPVIFISCEDLLNDLLTAETDYYEMDFTVPASDRTGFQIFSEEVFPTGLKETLNEAGINEEKLESVHLKDAEISITSQGIYRDFNTLKFVELTVYHDSLGEREIAALDPVPRDTSLIRPELTSDDLLPYFSADTLIITVQGFLLDHIYEDIDMHARVKFEIKGGI